MAGPCEKPIGVLYCPPSPSTALAIEAVWARRAHRAGGRAHNPTSTHLHNRVLQGEGHHAVGGCGHAGVVGAAQPACGWVHAGGGDRGEELGWDATKPASWQRSGQARQAALTLIRAAPILATHLATTSAAAHTPCRPHLINSHGGRQAHDGLGCGPTLSPALVCLNCHPLEHRHLFA